MFKPHTSHPLGAICLMVSLAAFILTPSVSHAQTIEDLDRNGDGEIDIEDLLDLLSLDPPRFSISDLFFLLGNSWNVAISTSTPTNTPEATPTSTETPEATAMPTSTPEATPTPTPTTDGGGPIYNIGDYFVTSQGSNWHYTGFNGGSTEDDYTWTVENELQNVGLSQSVSRFRTDTDEPTDERNGAVDFIGLQGAVKGLGGSAGDLFYFGVFQAGGVAAGVSSLIASDPILLGRVGLQVGDMIEDTGAASVSIGGFPATVNLTSTVRYTAMLPTFETPLGTFTNVLRMEIDISGEVVTGFGTVPFKILGNTFFLKEGAGVIAVDLESDPGDTGLLAIDAGTVFVGGNPVAIVAN